MAVAVDISAVADILVAVVISVRHILAAAISAAHTLVARVTLALRMLAVHDTSVAAQCPDRPLTPILPAAGPMSGALVGKMFSLDAELSERDCSAAQSTSAKNLGLPNPSR
jgi:hypothetical protein